MVGAWMLRLCARSDKWDPGVVNARIILRRDEYEYCSEHCCGRCSHYL